MTDHALHPSAIAPDATFLARLIARLGRWYVRRVIAYQTRRELAGLSDEILRDIRLTRCDIDYVANAFAEASADARWPGARR